MAREKRMLSQHRRTLFSKYLQISLAIVLVSFLILGVMLVFFVARYSENDKRELLTENAHSVADLISDSSTLVNNNLILGQSNLLQTVMATISKSINASIFITNNAGVTQLCSEGANCVHEKTKIPDSIMKNALGGEYFETSNLGGLYKNNYYTVGVPIIVNANGQNIAVGVAFVSSGASSISEFTTNITKIFFFAAIATFAIVFCMVGLYTYNMVRPLRQMAHAAKSFGAGDFSSRVPVTSQDEIGQLAIAFNNMADSLATSEGTRRSFIANVSHELKTPMTTIAGFIDGILDGTIPPERQGYYLKIVSTEVRRLSRLVQSMLALSRIDSGELRMNKQRFDMTNILITTLLTFEQKIGDRNICVEGLEEAQTLFVDGDPDMIHQVVYNLIENAVKFTDEGGYIRIGLTDSPDRTTLEIRNSGQGIQPDELPHIFERFYKTDKSRSKDKNGMGLGLYIVKTILRLHGGDITVASEAGSYCSFTLWLPKEKESAPLKLKDKADKPEKKDKGDKPHKEKKDGTAEDAPLNNEEDQHE